MIQDLETLSTSGAGNNDGIFLTRKDIFDCYDLPRFAMDKGRIQILMKMLFRSIQDSLESGIPIDGMLSVINFLY
jgi:hypothetical protein